MGRHRHRHPDTTAIRCPTCGWRTTKIPKECRRNWNEHHPEGCQCKFGSCWKESCHGALLITQDEYTWAIEKRQEEEAEMGQVQVIAGEGGGMFETGITRSEAIDIVIEELRVALEGEVSVAEKAFEKAKEAQAHATQEAGKALLASNIKDATFKLGYNQSTIEISVPSISKRHFPAKLLAAIKAYDKTKADLFAARQKLGKFNAGATRNRIRVLRASLEASTTGKAFLKKVDDLKAKISRQLLAA